MGWCSGTGVFDPVAEYVLECDNALDSIDKKEVLTTLIVALEDHDWDCHCDSDYFNHPLVQEILIELHPDWVEDDNW